MTQICLFWLTWPPLCLGQAGRVLWLGISPGPPGIDRAVLYTYGGRNAWQTKAADIYYKVKSLLIHIEIHLRKNNTLLKSVLRPSIPILSFIEKKKKFYSVVQSTLHWDFRSLVSFNLFFLFFIKLSLTILTSVYDCAWINYYHDFCLMVIFLALLLFLHLSVGILLS